MGIRNIWWLIPAVMLSASVGQAQPKPLNPRIDSLFPAAPVNYLTDMAAMVADPDPVNARFAYIRDSLKLSLVAVTLETTREFDVADVAREIGRKWMVATANDTIGATVRNTGAVILLVADSRQCRIETATGSEGYLTDATAASLCRTARAEFREGRFGPGLIGIADSIAEFHVAAMTPTAPQTSPVSAVVVWGVIFSCIAAVLLAYGYRRYMRRLEKEEEDRAEQQRKQKAEADRRARLLAQATENTRLRNEQAAIRTQTTQARRDVMSPEAQEEERLATERRRQTELDRAAKQRRDDEYRAEQLRRDEVDDSYRRSSSTSYDYGSSSDSSSSSSSDSGYSSGGSDSFSGGGGGSDW